MTVWQLLLTLAVGAALGAAAVWFEIGAEVERRAERRRRDLDGDARWHRPIRPPRSHCTPIKEEKPGG